MEDIRKSVADLQKLIRVAAAHDVIASATRLVAGAPRDNAMTIPVALPDQHAAELAQSIQEGIDGGDQPWGEGDGSASIMVNPIAGLDGWSLLVFHVERK